MQVYDFVYPGFFVFILLSCGIMLFLNNLNIGATDGTHTGIITAVEHNSNLLFSADIVYFKTDGQSSQEDKYCIEERLIPMAKEMARKNKRVTINFQNDFVVWKWECNGGDSIIYHINDG